jgi:acetyl esterase/lipase
MGTFCNKQFPDSRCGFRILHQTHRQKFAELRAKVPVKLYRYDGMIHGFVSFPEIFRQARDALDRIAAEVNTAG